MFNGKIDEVTFCFTAQMCTLMLAHVFVGLFRVFSMFFHEQVRLTFSFFFVLKVRRYLDKGVYVDWSDNMGWTALMLACRQKETEIGKLLVEHGADIKRAGNNRWTPLHYAAHSNDVELVKLFLEKGADKMALTTDGKTPRDVCVKWATKKMFYSRPEYEVEYERWLYPEKYEEEQRLKEEADRARWEEIKERSEKKRLEKQAKSDETKAIDA